MSSAALKAEDGSSAARRFNILKSGELDSAAFEKSVDLKMGDLPTSTRRLKIITSLSADKRLDCLIGRLRDGGGSPYLIVPEQFLFETERNMYKVLGARRMGQVNIKGFSKLTSDIIKKHGETKLYADDIVKGATMYKTVRRLSPEFKYYKNISASPGFARRMLELAAELKNAGLKPGDLRKAVFGLGLNDALSSKLTDITEIYCAYCETLESEYADRLDDNTTAADLINIYDCFKSCDVFFYGYDSFCESQLNLLNAVVGSAQSTSLLLQTDGMVSGDDAFKAMNGLIKRIERDNACEHIALGGEGFSPSVEYWTADDVRGECEFVAAKIRSLITEEGYSCNEIAVLACDKSSMPELREVFAEYEIKAFMDLPEPVIKKPLTRFIISALEAASLDTDKLLSYIRSGFVRVPAELEPHGIPKSLRLTRTDESKRYGYVKTGGRRTGRLSKRSMDLLERAAHTYRLTKREWANPFPEQNKELQRIEPLRREIVFALSGLQKCANGCGGDTITEAVCGFLLDTMQLQRTVLGICHSNNFFDKSADYTDEFRQLWDLIIDVFESLHQSLKDFTVSLREYTDLLRWFFTSTDIAKPPQVLDAVTVGDPERTRLNKVRAVFVVGANQGAFPKGVALSNEFSGKEAETLAEGGLKVTPRREERYNYGRFTVNKVMTFPSERLYICAPLRDTAWNEVQPSAVFNQADKINRVSELPFSFWVRTLKTARRLYAENTDNVNSDIIKAAFAKLGRELPPLNAVIPQSDEAATGFAYEHTLIPETAQRLFMHTRFSPTAIETLMSCRFKYFCKYGLGIDIPVLQNEEEPVSLERGNIIHYCLDAALRIYADNPEEFSRLNDADLDRLAEDCINNYRNTKLPDGYARTKRQQYILRSFKPGIIRMLRHIRSDFENSGFRPYMFEKRVDGIFGGVNLIGKIDRVDRAVADNGDEYIRVTDYKSGGKEMDFPSVFYGLDMQMLLYLFAVCGENSDGGNPRKPHSALYMPADGSKGGLPLEPSLAGDEKKARGNWLSAHVPSGIAVYSDGEPYYSELSEREQRYREESGASVKKSFFKVKRLSPAAYEKLKDYCGRLIEVQVKRVGRGNVQAVPVSAVAGGCVGCDYCDYSAVCGNKGEGRVKVVDRGKIDGVIDDTIDN